MFARARVKRKRIYNNMAKESNTSNKTKGKNATNAPSSVVASNSNKIKSVELNDLSYSKVLLHCSKFTYAACCGVLLASNESLEENELKIVDSIPLFHTQPTAAMMEVSSLLIEEYALEKKCTIAGFYLVNSVPTDTTVVGIYSLIATQLSAKTNEKFCFLLVNNIALADEKNLLPFTMYENNGSDKWLVGKGCGFYLRSVFFC